MLGGEAGRREDEADADSMRREFIPIYIPEENNVENKNGRRLSSVPEIQRVVEMPRDEAATETDRSAKMGKKMGSPLRNMWPS
ncbi:hypothetical protein DM860_002497 [Cuscuta australis]|uniref:Uncharacterized protein n=1 Tax=Cuscuta australis TaxID=267555 RepID=A0A328D2A3_9ASTE|nr:hypothetical protein DM860_002497 [Cuscuta australis]